MPAAEPVHLRIRLEPGQADRALLIRRAEEERSKSGWWDPAMELLGEGRELERLGWSLVDIGRWWEVDAYHVEDWPYDLFKDGDGEGRVHEEDGKDAFGRSWEAREPHLVLDRTLEMINSGESPKLSRNFEVIRAEFKGICESFQNFRGKWVP